MTGGLGIALWWGLAIALPDGPVDEPVALFTVDPPEPPPPRSVPPRKRSRRPEGAAAPPNLRSTATELVAPVPVLVPPAPPPVITAPVANTGAAPTQGAAPRPGPGTGAGGEGTGFGGGGSGDGDGGGWGDETPPRRIRGRLRDSDYPREAWEAGATGLVTVRYYVNVDGRVSGCRVTHSSGNRALDETTCRLVTERFRYRPSRDGEGRPVRSVVVVDHEWVMEDAEAAGTRP
jgi:periplasmic protein TonB